MDDALYVVHSPLASGMTSFRLKCVCATSAIGLANRRITSRLVSDLVSG